MSQDKRNISIEEEISKQIDNLDRRFDRNGWLFLVILIVIFFILLYLFMAVFRVPERETYPQTTELQQEIIQLNERVSTLEEQIIELENQ